MTINEIYIQIKKNEERIAECRREIINFENKHSELKNIRCEYLDDQEMLFEFMEDQNKNASKILNISNMNVARKYGESLSDFLKSREAEEAKNNINQIIVDINNALGTLDKKIENLENEIRTCYRRIDTLNESLRIEKQKETLKKERNIWQI